MDIKACVIDFQAFRNNEDRFIIKELVILDLLTFVAYPFTFEAPYSFNRLNAKAKITNKWLTKHFHRIHWYEGFISYSNLHSIIFNFCKQYSHIYTRGLEKRNWIQTYTHGQVYDITIEKDFNNYLGNICVAARDPKHGQTHCALQNAYRLAAYLKQNRESGGGGSGGGNGAPGYREVTPLQRQFYSRLQTGNISEDTTEEEEEDGITRLSENTS